jgi:hypothetical protein
MTDYSSGAVERFDDRAGFGYIVPDDATDAHDETSPIGSRASRHIISNLSKDAISEMLKHADSKIAEDEVSIFADAIHKQTGGHAGLSSQIVWRIAGLPGDRHSESDLKVTLDGVLIDCMQTMRIWNSALSDEAGVVRDKLARNQQLTLSQAAGFLAEGQYERFAADQAFDELEFTGIAIRNQDSLTRSNLIFWTYLEPYNKAGEATKEERELWELIEKTELAVRSFILSKYKEAWPDRWEAVMERVLGSVAWAKVSENLRRSARNYPYSPEQPQKDVIDCMYIGQLQMLIVFRDSWPLFSNFFKDRRQVEDIFRAITPVRNDRAHFNSVPQRELSRCRLSCGDLLSIVGQ